MSASLSSESPEVTTTAGYLTSTTAIADPPDLTTGVVGIPRPRIEGRAKVTGTARYAADVPMPDLAFGCVVTSTVSHGRIRDIDASAILHMPGVLGVIDHTNAPRVNREAGNFFGPHGGLHLLQDDEIPHAGRPIALVVAETLEEARAAADALPVTYDEQPHDTAFSADHPAARSAFWRLPDPVKATLGAAGEDANVGDVDAELAASAVVVDEQYCTPEEHCSAMEPHAATASWEEERLHAVDSNQGPFKVASVLATLFSLNLEQVRVRAEHVGGGFGSKGLCGPQLILAVMATTPFSGGRCA
jgi:xanthine dehydrogenase YagR molybdenum-binding subunit